MKNSIDLRSTIADAAEMVHRAYFGEIISPKASDADLQQPTPLDDVLRIPAECLRNASMSPARQSLAITLAAIDVRHHFARDIASKAYANQRDDRSRRNATVKALYTSEWGYQTREAIIQNLADSDDRLSLVGWIQEWRCWDDSRVQGWIFEQVELAIEEMDFLWGKIRVIAIRLKTSPHLEAGVVRELCDDILGAGLKGDRELAVISRFHYDRQFHGYGSDMAIHRGIPFVKFECLANPEERRHGVSVSEIADHLSKRMPYLANGLDAGASAARVVMLLHDGNYVAVGDRLRRVSLPIEPTEGNFEDLSRPETLHPMPRDYAWCARRSIGFAAAGFLWPTMVAAGHEAHVVKELIDQFWIPKMLESLFDVSAGVAGDDALAYTAAVIPRLMAVEGWLNPMLMRQHLPVVFLESAWNEIRRARGEAIQIGRQEHQIIDEELIGILVELLPSIAQEANIKDAFPLVIPPERTIRGSFSFYKIFSLEEGFLAPEIELGMVRELNTIFQWRA